MARVRQGSVHRPLRARAYADSSPVDFPAEFPGGIRFRMVCGAIEVSGPASGDRAGNLVYQWATHDLDTPGTYAAVFIATDAAGRTETFPTESNIEIVVVPAI